MKYSRYILGAFFLVGILILTKAIVNFTTVSEEVDKPESLDYAEETLEVTVAEKLEEAMDNEIASENKEKEVNAANLITVSQTTKTTQLTTTNQKSQPTKTTEPIQPIQPIQPTQMTSTGTTNIGDAGGTLSSHQVAGGESLFHISRQYEVNVEELRKVNNLTSDEILVGQVLTIPAGIKPKTQAVQTASRGSTTGRFTENDIYWLAKIIHAEARGESYQGQVAVGAVILNRVKSQQFPNTVYDVIFDKWDGKYYQFSPVLDGTINLEPNQTAYKAARDAINGSDPTDGALYFYNPITSTSSWIYELPIIKKIGKHVFA